MPNKYKYWGATVTLLPLLAVLFYLSLPHLVGKGPAAEVVSEKELAQTLLLSSVRYAEISFSNRTNLLPGKKESTRDSTWFALGLLQRDAPGDGERAVLVLRAVLSLQLKTPGKPWHGTFSRGVGERIPMDGAREFIDYDPNWREFIASTFFLILTGHAAQLPSDLRLQLEEAIVTAVEGELASSRLKLSYTNIALLHGFLLGVAGQLRNRLEWIEKADDWLEELNRLFQEYGTFAEFNSPTYYGVDLFALALLRRFGVTQRARDLGAGLEASLWNDIALFYNAELKNLCGPFDRSYGMNMNKYVTLVGLWLGLVLRPELVPLPPLPTETQMLTLKTRPKLDHGSDFVCIPTYIAVGTVVPSEALAKFRDFGNGGERRLTRLVGGKRVATAWISRHLMVGAEATGLSQTDTKKGLIASTVHWRAANSSVGWISLRTSPPIDAIADKNLLKITILQGNLTLHVSVPGLRVASLTRRHWSLPNLLVDIESNAREFRVSEDKDIAIVEFSGVTTLQLSLAYTGHR